MSRARKDLPAFEFHSSSENETLQFAADVAMVLQPGDMIGLSGDLGVGKSVFCRGIIQHLAGSSEYEVTSPTYTLCNLYDTVPNIAHYDLYRIGGFDETDELGIDDALDRGCALIEWPEKGFETFPSNAVLLTITESGETGRLFSFSGSTEIIQRIKRSIAIRKFLQEALQGVPFRGRLAADASARRYESINAEADNPLLLMDAPEMPDGPVVRDGKPYSQIAHLAESVTAFVAIGNLLNSKNLGGPALPACDLEQGLVLIEHMGSGSILDKTRAPIDDRYMHSAEYLAHLHEEDFSKICPLPDGSTYEIPDYDQGAMMIEAELLLDWYVPAHAANPLSEDTKLEFKRIWQELFFELESQEKSLVLRDYHSPNIIWRSEREGLQRIGVIDFQDALIGPAAYDLASLAQDARVDVPPALQDKLLEHYLDIRKHKNAMFDSKIFKTGFAIMAAQRATKILGIFVRLNERDGKAQYLQHIPRVQAYLERSLQHPVMCSYRQWIKSAFEL